MTSHPTKDLNQLRITPQDVVDLIYDTLECLHDILMKNNIPYTIFCGTALGAERHGGLIPWDDDADTAILSESEQKFVELSDIFASRGFILSKALFVGYRLYHESLTKLRAHDQYPFPFVDIFLLNDTGTSYECSSNEARIYWPQVPLLYGCFDHLVNVQFGHLTLRGLSANDMKQHLDDNYGKDWPYVAWREWDHYL
ncbi:unnamed protein product [Rotaria sp. Silwood2]|nr:unnamed protein product [Rotaria sp. Silwood2]CAF3182007.1 unnamed protein product [Rotaria sp. Silwood2]CAF3333756.1 unnamed protein product [Rotaria sp. Silwood2]CAF3378468.1 unnamed protein product [Rotaria sp. Silwood2]CAF4531587.1 unnamed protein product [Rotaria sp. Silwood2]